MTASGKQTVLWTVCSESADETVSDAHAAASAAEVSVSETHVTFTGNASLT